MIPQPLDFVPGSDFARSYVGRLRARVGSMPLIVVTNRVIIERPDSCILLEHRADFDCWGLPGGCVEDGESMEQSVHREILEETGLVISNPIPFGYASDPIEERLTYPNGDVALGHSMMFHVRNYSGKPRAHAGENLGLGWFLPAALPHKLLPNTPRTVAAFLRYKNTGQFQLI